MAIKATRPKYQADVYVDPTTTIELDMDDPQDVCTAAEVNRLKKAGDFEGIVEIHATHPLFKTKMVRAPEKVATRTVYVLVNKSGVTSKIKDPAVLPMMQKDGFTLDHTEEEDIIG